MSRLIERLQIQNFKSVRDLALDCERINVFIGKPNAGKSNILEAISLLGVRYAREKFMDGFIRYKTVVQLFSNFNFREPIKVRANQFVAQLSSDSEQGGSFNFAILPPDTRLNYNGRFRLDVNSVSIAPNGTLNKKILGEGGLVKKYEFKTIDSYQEQGLFLHPPHGDNFYLIVRSNQELREEIQRFLKPNGLELLLDEESQRIVVVKKDNGSLLSFPLHLLPDTFQRYIFHLAAILSNRDSVLLFEEPETHSYAPYVYQLAQQIIDDENGNQFFLTTHNPYLLTPILQESKDVALFVTWFENYQTHARRLTEQELSDVLNYGMDIFLNLNHFIPE